ncbi:sensor histidine kinase N-terminal domain-containing protein [Seohaeicola saemankumensis]|nr:sensor histidine kinase N-terminal domain-containing protein [Seohaeicola saemankumensis]
MTWWGSLRGRLIMTLGGLLVALWITVAFVTSLVLRNEMYEVFDTALQETAQRILPLAVVDVVGREDVNLTQRLGAIRAHDEGFTYIVRNAEGLILIQSHTADPAHFPPYAGPGFQETTTHRLYSEVALQGSIRITVAEPLTHRATVAREIQMALGVPLLVLLPLTFLSILVALRTSLAPLTRFRERLNGRSARDLSAVPTTDLPTEIAPVAVTLNSLLSRLKDAFDAERSFASNAAHELRTPLAGAIAQAQRLQSETSDPAAQQKAHEIEVTLKRLTRLAEKLMQLSRAEGARLRQDMLTDLRAAIRIVVEDLARSEKGGRIDLSLPDQPVLSDMDPDAVGIVTRNLIENALRHGEAGEPVAVTLTADGALSVANAGPVLPRDMLDRLTERFQRGADNPNGSGLGLAIVAAISDRIEGKLTLRSPRRGAETGFEARLNLPVQKEDAVTKHRATA